jgi:MFS family permease
MAFWPAHFDEAMGGTAMGMSQARRSLGRKFAWLWTAYAISTAGTWLAFDAFPLIAIIVLHAGPAEVSALAAAGLAVGSALAVPLGPWMEFRRKRPLMIAMDLIRFAALLSVPVAFALGRFAFVHLLIVSCIVGAANIAFKAASGAFLKALVPPEDLIAANARFEATTWTATALGPPLGGIAIGLFGPITTVVTDALSYLLSAVAVSAMGDGETHPARGDGRGLRAADLIEGWRCILAHPVLCPLFFNTILLNGLIMATAPLVAVLMLGQLGFTPWQYGLAFGAPCVGGLVGARLARPLAARFGQHKVLLIAGALRACWSLGLAFIGPGVAGIALVIAVEFGLVGSMGVFNPVFASYRLQHTEQNRVARVLSARSISGSATIAAMMLLWGLLGSITGPRAAIAIAGVLMLATPLLLPRRDGASARERQLARTAAVGTGQAGDSSADLAASTL